MNILNKISKKNLFLNKKRTLGTIVGIILSVSLICASAGLFTSFRKTILQNAINESGYFHFVVYDVSNEDIKDLKVNRKVLDVKTMHDIGVAKLNDDYMYFYSTDYFDDLSFEIIDGRKPKNENEIVVNKRALLELNKSVGDTINLGVGTRKTNDGFDLDESNPYHEDIETLVDVKDKTYKIVGVFSKYGYTSPNYALTVNEKSERIDAYISLKNPSKYEKDIPSILGQSSYDDTIYREIDASKYNYGVNQELLRWEVFAFSDSTITMLYSVVAFVIGVIIVTSVYCIRNSFAISTNEKTKMYGMLASVGATKKQIRKCVIKEAFILGLIGVPIGIISGVFADFVLIKIVNYIMGGYLFNSLDEIIFNVSFMGLLISIVLGFVTIYLSSLGAAIKASKVSPIENLTNRNDIKIKKEKLKTPKFIEKLFKTGGVLAYKNLKRSKNKYRTTVISLIISVFVFITMNSFLTESFDLTDKYYNEYDYNVRLGNVSALTNEDLMKLSSISDIKKFYILYDINDNSNGYIKLTDKDKMNIIDEIGLDADCTLNSDGDRVCTEGYYRSLQLVALDNKSFMDYVKKLKIDYDEIKSGGILVDEYKYQENGKEKVTRGYKYEKGEKIKGKLNGEDILMEVAYVASVRPFGLENTYYGGGYLVVNKDSYENLDFTPYSISIDTDKPDEVIKEIESYNSDIFVTNYDETRREDHAMRLVISIFLYGFIAVITLIGVTNIFNTINSNMELRSKEFAMLKSIGMTRREFSHMVNLETIFYSFKSLLYGIILGLIGSLVLHKAFSEKSVSPFKIPYVSILISIIFVIFIVYIIMRFSISKINKQNTIETIRKDNI